MNDAEFDEAVYELLAMHKKIYRQRSPEYVYDRWWKRLIMLRFAESDMMYGKFFKDYRRAAKLVSRVRRMKHLMGMLTTKLGRDEILNQGNDVGNHVWFHCKIYGREYIFTRFGQLFPAMVSSNCHYIIDYHDKDTV